MVNSFDETSFEKINQYFVRVNSQVIKLLGPNADLKGNIDKILSGIKDFVINSGAAILGSIAEAILGLFVMFFIMYYSFMEGYNWTQQLKEFLPFTKERRDKLVKGIKGVTHAVIYGQVFIALLEGILGGVGFLIVGIHNPVFWGFIMTVLAFIPLVGAGLIWVPAGIIEIVNHNVLGGIFIMVFCFFVFTVIDNLLRPRIISGKGKIHPIVGLIGVLGGLKLFGFLGIIIGPIIAALFITMAEFFYEDYMKEK
jgi:predicted PurR-regulated permease PerM